MKEEKKPITWFHPFSPNEEKRKMPIVYITFDLQSAIDYSCFFSMYLRHFHPDSFDRFIY